MDTYSRFRSIGLISGISPATEVIQRECLSQLLNPILEDRTTIKIPRCELRSFRFLKLHELQEG